MVDLQRFKKINIRHKCIVYGYIREIQSTFPSDISYFNIHELIKQTCTLFFAPIHEWDTNYISSRMEFIKESNSIIHKIYNNSGCSYLKDTFDSGVHHWKFKIDKVKPTNYWSCTIGLYAMRKGDPKTNSALYGYGYKFNKGRLTGGGFQPGIKAKSGDIVEMHCDMNQLGLSFMVNGVDSGLAFENIDKTVYKVAVNLYEKNDKVTLLE